MKRKHLFACINMFFIHILNIALSKKRVNWTWGERKKGKHEWRRAWNSYFLRRMLTELVLKLVKRRIRKRWENLWNYIAVEKAREYSLLLKSVIIWRSWGTNCGKWEKPSGRKCTEYSHVLSIFPTDYQIENTGLNRILVQLNAAISVLCLIGAMSNMKINSGVGKCQAMQKPWFWWQNGQPHIIRDSF